jgi:hypothetical protein
VAMQVPFQQSFTGCLVKLNIRICFKHKVPSLSLLSSKC